MPKKVSLILIIFLALFLGYNLIVQISTTLKSADKLEQATEVLYNLELKNKELKSKLSEVKSPEFIEKEARDKLGLAKEGETVVVIPHEELEKVLGEQKKEEIKRLPNWQGWLRLFSK